MLQYKITYACDQQQQLYTNLKGKALLSIPQFNKGTAFSLQERIDFDLLGKLPERVETLEEQVARAYEQYCAYDELLNRNIYLNNLLNTNQTLFYKLLSTYLPEMLPTVYTPIVGSAVQTFNRMFRQPRGIYISYPNREHMQRILANRSHPNIKLMVVTDGEGVLGIGDQGIGAMDIPVAKLAVYTAFAHLNPMHVLPIMLDVGTNNSQLLEDPLYLGWRHERIQGEQYNAFLEEFIDTVKQSCPHALVHWEDLGRANAQHALEKYRKKVCSFNDDIQGTGIVCLAAILKALQKTNAPLNKQKIVVYGAGTAGMGIVQHITQALCKTGLTHEQAADCFYLLDRSGLLTEHSPNLTTAQKPYVRSQQQVDLWSCENNAHITLFETIQHVKPSILIGCSAQAGAFNQAIVQEMAKHHTHPIIMPLSNPNDKSEATPADLYRWTDGKVLAATGSPFAPIQHNQDYQSISQCNNYLAFPGLGLGAIAVRANTITDNMLHAASCALGAIPLAQENLLLPGIDQAEAASLAIAKAVAKTAREDGVAENTQDDIASLIAQQQWQPRYLPYTYCQDLQEEELMIE